MSDKISTPADLAAERSPSPLAPERVTIWIIDADAGCQSAAALLVSHAGYRPRLFSSVATFLEAYEPPVPGCLLADAEALISSGMELGPFLKEKCRHATLIIADRRNARIAIDGFEAGACGLLEKPVEPRHWLQKIEGVV